MAGSITPLPVMLEEEDRKLYEKLEAPKSIVVRYGYQRLVAELPYSDDAKPGCGSKLVIRTNRGIELAEMLTTTCPNSGCASAISRKQMLQYIDNSGGKDYPFTNQGKVLRIADIEDLNEQRRMDADKPRAIQFCKQLIREMDLSMRLVEVEFLLGGDRVMFYYTAEQWVDFRELVKRLASEMQTRIEMVQVNAREEARLVADYEKCGQHCCCKQFLKVLKPVSMRSAKVQKATLDPHKISGRCGRLMCCLRYEDKTYSELKKNLPRRKSVVETEDGIGIVWDTQILTQLALVKIGPNPAAAYPIENLRVLSNEEAKAFNEEERRLARERQERREQREQRGGYRNRQRPAKSEASQTEPAEPETPPQAAAESGNAESGGGKKKRRRRRRRRKKGGEGGSGGQGGGNPT